MEKKLPINGLQKGIFLDEKQDIWFYLENILIFVEREQNQYWVNGNISHLWRSGGVGAKCRTLKMNNNIEKKSKSKIDKL